jgi:hypothetical protein
LRAEAAVIARLLSLGGKPYRPTLFVEESEILGSDENKPILMPSVPKRKGKGKGKEKEKRKGTKVIKTIRKRVRFEFEEDKPEKEKEVEKEALLVLRKSRRVGRLLKKARGLKTTL